MDITVPNKVKDTSIEQNFQSLIDQLNDKIESLESELSQVKDAGLWIPAISAPVVVGSTVTSFTVGSGLSLDTDKEWLLTIRLKTATGTFHQPRIGLRGLFSDANYQSAAGRTLVADPGGHNGELRILAGGMNAAEYMTATIKLSKRVNEPMLALGRSTYSNSNPGTDSYHFSLTDRTTGDVPSIQVGSTVSNRILAGTEAMLYKRVG